MICDIEAYFIKAKSTTGKVSNRNFKTVKNHQLIREIATKHGFLPVYSNITYRITAWYLPCFGIEWRDEKAEQSILKRKWQIAVESDLYKRCPVKLSNYKAYFGNRSQEQIRRVFGNIIQTLRKKGLTIYIAYRCPYTWEQVYKLKETIV